MELLYMQCNKMTNMSYLKCSYHCLAEEGQLLPYTPYHVPSSPQVTWIYEPKEGKRTNIAVFHPRFGPNYPDSPVKGRVSFTASPINMNSPSIQITDVRMTDEGKYICEFATYPSGNEQGIIYLVMLGKSFLFMCMCSAHAHACLHYMISHECSNVTNRPP